MAVELELMCHGLEPHHPFRVALPDPVDWAEVANWLKHPAPRCEEHPDQSSHWCE